MTSDLDLVIKAVKEGRKYKDVLAEEEASRDLRNRRGLWVNERVKDIPDLPPGEKTERIRKLFEQAEKEVI